MTNNFFKMYHFDVDRVTTLSMMSKDYKRLVGDHDRYTINQFYKENLFSYKLLIETWVTLMDGTSLTTLEAFASSIANEGLLSVIGSASSYAETVIGGLNRSTRDNLSIPSIDHSSLWSLITFELLQSGKKPADILNILRYPKRFAPRRTPLLQKEALADFVANENIVKRKSTHEYSPYLMELMRQVFHELFAHYKGGKFNEIFFTSGVCYDAARDKVSKLAALLNNRAEILDHDIIYHEISYRREPISEWYGAYYKRSILNDPHDHVVKYNWFRYHLVEIKAVPKSYKATRIIAPDHASYLCAQTTVMHRLEEVIKRNHLPIYHKDQQANREQCYFASISESHVTIDQSHASDMVSRTLCAAWYPPTVFSEIQAVSPTHYRIGGKIRTMQQMSPAGCRHTYLNECFYFLGFVLASYYLCGFTKGKIAKMMKETFVVGDDLIIPTEVYPTFLELCDYFGLQINEGKTFCDGHYRESCGAEYYDGVDTSASYFPRKPIVVNWDQQNKKYTYSSTDAVNDFQGQLNDPISQLVSLNQRLYSVSSAASEVVLRYIRLICPNITTSMPYTFSTDPWSPLVNYYLGNRPYGKNRSEQQKFYSTEESKMWYPEVRLDLSGKEKVWRATGKSVLLYKGILHSYAGTRLVKPQHPHSLAYAMDLLNYEEFLEKGPYYEDSLSKLLGVSTSRSNVAVDGSPIVSWRKEITEVPMM